MTVMIMVVVVLVVLIYIEEEQNLCWFHFLICIPKKKSRYVIAGPLLVLPTCPTDYFFLTINLYHDLGLRMTVISLYRQITSGFVAQD